MSGFLLDTNVVSEIVKAAEILPLWTSMFSTRGNPLDHQNLSRSRADRPKLA